MIRLLLRIFGIVSLAGGFVALVVDGTRSIAAGRVMAAAFGDTVSHAFPTQFNALRVGVERGLHPLLWDPALASFFLLPTFLVMASIGVLLLASARRSRRRIGYSSRD